MRTAVIVVACASLVAIASGAPAALATTGTFEVRRLPGSTLPAQTLPRLTGPLPAGDGVVYALGGTDSGAVIRLVAPGGAMRDVAVLVAKDQASLALHASPTRIAAVRNAYVCDDCRYMSYRSTLDALLAGPLGGPLTTITQCETGQSCAATYFCSPGRPRFGAALGGDLLVVRDECGQSVSVTNLAGGPAVQLGKADVVAVGGPYVALGEQATVKPQSIVVRDAVAGTELYRTLTPGALGYPVTSIALAGDGTVVYSVSLPRGVAVLTASPAAPAGRVLRANLPYGTAVLGTGPAGALLRSDSRLELVLLDGAAARSFDLPDLLGAVAFDGRTIAWARRSCVTTAITSWTLGDPAPTLRDLRCPTPRPSRAAVTMRRNRSLSVALTCPASARGGCLAGVRLTAIRRGRLPRGSNGAERSYRLGSVPVALDPGEIARAELLVPAGAARWVRRHAPLRLRIEARSERTASQRPPGEPAVVARAVALRAAR